MKLLHNKTLFVFVCLLLAGMEVRVYANENYQWATYELTFQDFLNRVGKNNLDYIVEKFNIKIAEAEVIAAKVLPDPEVTFEALDDNYIVELEYNLELGNKRKARVRLARSEAELEKLAVEYFFQELRAEAADAFLETIMQREILQFKQSSYKYMRQLSLSDSIRYSLGEITENDARQSRLEAASLLNEVYEQEAVYKSALVVLNQYMGQSADTLNIPVGDLHIPDQSFNMQELVFLALDNRVDLLAALKESEVAMNQLRLTKAERRMDLGLMVGYEKDWGKPAFDRSFLKAGFSVPLKFSNINKGAVRSAKYAIEKSKTEYHSIELQVQTEVAQAFFNYEAMQKQVLQFDAELIEDAQKLLDGIVYKYQRGETDILEVLIAQRTYNEIQEQYLETLKGYALALIELERVCGTWDYLVKMPS
ncbi:MAG: TolC family protein [Tannerellaceae bacterium]|nr:TolC family protein [Tannerellaceae bacterium]